MNKNIETVSTAKNFIEQNITKDITPEDAAASVNYSVRQLNRIFSLYTGLTLSEHIRYGKLVNAFFALKYKDSPIIDIALEYGYETQEGFTRAFKESFGITPGEYRKARPAISVKNYHLNVFIHKLAHCALDDGHYEMQNVEIWNVVKPARIWASAKKNLDHMEAPQFYMSCVSEGVMDKTAMVPNIITEGGAYFEDGLCFGVELESDYPINTLNGFDFIQIPQSEYIIFHCDKYLPENHGDVIFSTWNAQKEYDIGARNLKWDYKGKPIIEEDTDDGYTLWFPVLRLERNNM